MSSSKPSIYEVSNFNTCPFRYWISDWISSGVFACKPHSVSTMKILIAIITLFCLLSLPGCKTPEQDRKQPPEIY
jgi:hypothetical protein